MSALRDCSPLTRRHFPHLCAPVPPVTFAPVAKRPARAKPSASPPGVDWHALWAELHRRALAGTMTREWLAEFGRRVPSASCSCRPHYAKWVAGLTETDLAPDAQFAATVALHNSVNAKLGKPSLTVEAARERWG